MCPEASLRLPTRTPAELTSVCDAGSDTRRQSYNLCIVARNQWQVANQRPISYPPQCAGVRLQQLRFCGDVHLFLDGAELELNIQSRSFSHVHMQSGLYSFLEPGFYQLHLIRARL